MTTTRPPIAAGPSPVPIPPAGARASRWVGVPTRRDPRLPFAAILTSYAVLGAVWLGFNRSPLQMLLIVVAGCVLDMALHYMLRGRTLLVPLSAFISSLSIALLLNFSHDSALLLAPVFLTIASKYIFTLDGSHVFNPSLFGVVMTLVLAGNLVTIAPAYQWGGTWLMSIYMVVAAVAIVVTRVGRGWLVGSFLLFYLLQTLVRAYIVRHHIPPEALIIGTLSTPPFFLFTFFMITDPKTSPNSRRGQVALAAAIAIADLGWHLVLSVFTFFYAAFTVATVRYVWGHGCRLRTEGPATWLRTRPLSRGKLRAVAAVALLGLPAAATYATVIRPHVPLRNPGFTLVEVAPAASGVDLPVNGDLYDLVDPKAQNVGKWLLSVGSAIATPDIDRDGLPDLAVTSLLADPQDRIAIFRNAGNMRFERLSVPAFARFAGSPREVGLPSGMLWLDYDDDGRTDLLVTASFGASRLYRNETSGATGKLALRDVTEQAGLDTHTVSLAANALDYDRDGDLDVLLANALNPQLDEYKPSRDFNLFDLPDPAYDGDRRMLHFMHNGWHNADNGGENLLLENRGDGTFRTRTGSELGMPQTRWSISVATADFNEDGFTDLYIANDFGPDDLYLNTKQAGAASQFAPASSRDLGTRTFRRVEGRWFGEIGKDTYKGMDATVADFDRNGHQDVYVSNVHEPLQAEGSLLWMNDGPSNSGVPKLHDEATRHGILNEERFGWGAEAGDLDNDGWIDLVQANGMIGNRLDPKHFGGIWGKVGGKCPNYWYVNHKLMQSSPEIHTYSDQWGDIEGMCIFPDEQRRVYLNRGAGEQPQFVDVAKVVGMTRGANSRGVALADLDADGLLDVAISNQDRQPTLMRSTASAKVRKRAWVGLRLIGNGVSCAREALGSRVSFDVAGKRPIVWETHAVNGFSSQGDGVLHVGLGARSGAGSAQSAVDVTVAWCGGDSRHYQATIGKVTTVRQ